MVVNLLFLVLFIALAVLCGWLTWRAIRARRLWVKIAGGLGALKGQVWRVGLMGYSSQHRNVTLLLGALREVPAPVWGLSLLNATLCTFAPVLMVMMAVERIGVMYRRAGFHLRTKVKK